jgi:hypothetical protein
MNLPKSLSFSIRHLLKVASKIRFLGASFDPFFYSRIYPDLRPLTLELLKSHWIIYGKTEGRIGSLKHLFGSLNMRIIWNFSASWYKSNNPDLIQDWSYLQCLVHYLQFGRGEGRIFKKLNFPVYLQISILENAMGRPIRKDEMQILDQESRLTTVVNRIKTIFFSCEKYKEISRINHNCTFCLINHFSLQILSRDLDPYEISIYTLKIKRSFEEGLEDFFTHLFSRAFREPWVLEKFLNPELVSNLVQNPSSENNVLGGHKNKIQGQLESNLKSPIFHRLKIHEPQKISLICSAYNGIEYVRNFLTNTVNLKGFKDLCELIIFDANSTEKIDAIIKPFAEKYSNIYFSRLNVKLSIYETWNQLINRCKFELISNSNLDDIKHPNFLIEFTENASRLNNFDVFYSDYLYTNSYDPEIFNSQIRQISTYLPQADFFSLIHFNSPHCSPVWRKSLHQRVGLFDESLISSADWDFWIRCAKQNVKFIKIPGPLVAYYHNPDGLSTSPTSKGVREQWKIRQEYREFLFNKLINIEQEHLNLSSTPSLNHKLLYSYIESSSNL